MVVGNARSGRPSERVEDRRNSVPRQFGAVAGLLNFVDGSYDRVVIEIAATLKIPVDHLEDVTKSGVAQTEPDEQNRVCDEERPHNLPVHGVQIQLRCLRPIRTRLVVRAVAPAVVVCRHHESIRVPEVTVKMQDGRAGSACRGRPQKVKDGERAWGAEIKLLASPTVGARRVFENAVVVRSDDPAKASTNK